MVFLILCAHNCHRIVLDSHLRSRFYARINEGRSLQRKGELLAPGILDALTMFVATEGKITEIARESPPLESESGIPKEDRLLARAAKAARAPIVTGDDAFRSAVNASQELRQAGVEARSPKDAIDWVRERS